MDARAAQSNQTVYDLSVTTPVSHEKTTDRPWKPSNMADLFKACHGDNGNYSEAATDNIERKFMLFLERCKQTDVLEDGHHRPFSIMLAGYAGQFYCDVLKQKNLTFNELKLAVKSRFLTSKKNKSTPSWMGVN